VGGQAFDYRENRFAEMQTFAFGQDRPLFGLRRLVASTELTAAVFHQGTGYPGKQEWNAAFALATVVAFRGGPEQGIGYRLELGAGPSYAIKQVPSNGTKFNFYDQGGASITLRKPWGGYALGYRMVHLSNLLLNPNPGITLHTLVFALEWARE